MVSSLDNKRAIVTGGSRGIGFAIAKSLSDAGAQVLISGRSEEFLTRATAQLGANSATSKIVTFRGDVANPAEVDRMFELADKEFGGLDILINNAGVGVFHPTAELTVEQWDHVLKTNVSGAFYCSRAAIPRFKHNPGGFIINISSLAGKNPFAGGAAYNASKFAMNGFAEAMMLDHRQDGVRVSTIMPGSVDTGFSGQEPENRSDWKIQPEDIAEIVLSILRMPERTLISRVEVRPSRPAKH